MTESILIGYAEVSALTGIPVNTLKDHHGKRRGLGQKSAVIAGRVRFRKSDVIDWINDQFERPTEAVAERRFSPLGKRLLNA
ncbi:hypothetical protein [Mycobacterium paragordonae]|uniref:DNA-binding protein n=1 Tax=Mycobacterium paragordonae TaxID=1389713 RepID=A0ABQ1C0R1_9MYCO|nr:hypothetical protein [Mycobacterium paragordonae]GFG77900.1 hypothetical protein MPRG_11760 [Mycobacterium paragordonae]